MNVLSNLGRFAALALVFAGVAAFSDWPRHRSLPEDSGVLTLSFSHGADRRAACRRLTAEEIAKLPPNMRRPEACPRERPAVSVLLELDGEVLFEAEVPPSGIAGDGPSRVHQRFVLPVGAYDVALKLRDRPGDTFNWTAARRLEIGPAANRVIDFRPDAGGFVFH